MTDTKDTIPLEARLNLTRRGFLKTSAAGALVLGAGGLVRTKDAQAFAFEPYPLDDELRTVVTSCAHNCGSRHMLVAHKKGDVIVRLSTDDGRYQADGDFGKDTEEEPQLRACLRGRSYRQRLYSPERLLYPMVRVGKRGEGKFKRVTWDEARHTEIGHKTLLTLGFLAMVLGLWQTDNRWLLRLFNFAPFRFLGKISYGLYLIHLFMWPLHDWLVAHFDVLRDVPPLAARFGLTVLLATAMWHLFEAPILKLKARFQY